MKTRQRSPALPALSGLPPPWPAFLLRFNPVSDTQKRPAQPRKCKKSLDVDSLEDDLPFQPVAGNVTEPREAGISFTPCNSSFKLLKMFRLQTKLQWPIS